MKKIIQRTKGFEKSFQKLPKKIKKKFIEKLDTFIDDEYHPSLRTHQLKGSRKNEWSFSITNDIRSIYTKNKEQTLFIFTFVDIGTHNKIY